MNSKPLIIIGAGRSGTNILRDTLVRLPGYRTWDCDEINLIWRHGNINLPHDVFGPAEARPEVKSYVRRQFEKLEQQTGASVVVEKTCANALRVPFVDTIVPEARYIHIVRDGRDVVLSAMARWCAPVEMAYLAKKLRYVPVSDIPHYAFRFIRNRLHQRQSADRRQAVWGPIFPGMRDAARDFPLAEVCAMQWAACVSHASDAIGRMPSEKAITITYEDMVRRPDRTLANLCEWIEPGLSGKLPPDLAQSIHGGSAKGWLRKKDVFTPRSLEIMDAMLRRFNYETAA